MLVLPNIMTIIIIDQPIFFVIIKMLVIMEVLMVMVVDALGDVVVVVSVVKEVAFGDVVVTEVVVVFVVEIVDVDVAVEVVVGEEAEAVDAAEVNTGEKDVVNGLLIEYNLVNVILFLNNLCVLNRETNPPLHIATTKFPKLHKSINAAKRKIYEMHHSRIQMSKFLYKLVKIQSYKFKK